MRAMSRLSDAGLSCRDVVGRQFKSRNRLGELLEPPAFVRRAVRTQETLGLSARELFELRRGRQVPRLIQASRRVELAQFRQDDAGGPAVANEVMRGKTEQV